MDRFCTSPGGAVLPNSSNNGFTVNNGTNDLFAFGTGGFAVNGGTATDGGIRAYNNLVFGTGSSSTERMRIDSSGRVGIGLTNPGSFYASGDDLVVGGTGAHGITIKTGSTNQGILAFADGTSGGAQQYAGYILYDHSINDMFFATGASERLRIDSSGNVGIGATDVNAPLEVRNSSALQIRTSTSTGNYWEFGRDNSTGDFFLADDGLGTVVAVDQLTGNVGVGSTNPLTQLHILNTSGTSGFYVSRANGTTVGDQISIQLSTDSSKPRITGYGDGLTFFTAATSGTASERMRIDSSGNVGIGTTSPDALLEIESSAGGTSFSINNTGTSGRQYILQSTSSSSSIGGGKFSIYDGDAPAHRFVLDSSGNVGIGVSSLNNKLEVNGNQVLLANGQLKFADAGNSHVGIIKNSGASGNGQLEFLTGSTPTERMRIDSSGRLLVGHSSSRSVSAQMVVQIEGTNQATSSLSAVRNSNDAAPPNIVFGKSRGTSTGSNTVVQSGDDLGIIIFHGADGTDMNSLAADIKCEVDGTPGSNDMPGRLVFSTTADGASTTTEALRLDKQQRMYNLQAYTATTGSSANVVVLSDGRFLRSSSSNKYKTNIETLEDSYADAVLNCRPVWYQSTTEADNPEHGHWGFIAEEVAAIDPRLCFFKEEEDGRLEPEGVQYDRFVPHLLNLIKRQQSAIETLETKVAVLEAQ